MCVRRDKIERLTPGYSKVFSLIGVTPCWTTLVSRFMFDWISSQCWGTIRLTISHIHTQSAMLEQYPVAGTYRTSKMHGVAHQSSAGGGDIDLARILLHTINTMYCCNIWGDLVSYYNCRYLVNCEKHQKRPITLKREAFEKDFHLKLKHLLTEETCYSVL